MKVFATIKYKESQGNRFLISNGLATGFIERRKYGSAWLYNGFLGDRRKNQRRQKEIKR